LKLFDVRGGASPWPLPSSSTYSVNNFCFISINHLLLARMPVRCLTTGLTNEHASRHNCKSGNLPALRDDMPPGFAHTPRTLTPAPNSVERGR